MRLAPALLLAALVCTAYGADRSRTQRDHFQRETPCPATGQTKGPCPGYVVDHKTPLCAGGADAPANMQWQTVEAGKAKDRTERTQCGLRPR